MELSDIVISSKTQSAETIQKLLGDSGYESVETERLTDQPEEPAAEVVAEETPAEAPVEETPVEAEKTDSSVPSAEPGVESAGAEQDDESESEAESETAEPAAKQEKPKSGYKRKLALVQTDRDRYKSEVEDLKRQLAEKTAVKPTEEPKPEAKAEPAKEPQFEDFAEADDQLVAFNKAWMRWELDQRDRARAEQAESERKTKADNEAQAAAAAQREAVENSWNAQLTAAREKYEDFDELLADPSIKANNLMAVEFREREDGADLVYWLATHPEESNRINDLTEIKPTDTETVVRNKMRLATREMDKISALVAGDSAPAAETKLEKPPVATTAGAPPAAASQKVQAAPVAVKKKPAPPSPVGNRGAVAPRRPTEMSADELRNLDPKDWRKAREAEGTY